jgi:DNA-binding transcriptional ArsR family regulator
MTKPTPDIAKIASLVANPFQAIILSCLLDGRALTAIELAHATQIPSQTAGLQLEKMVAGDILIQELSGRHQYYRLANAKVSLGVGQALASLPATVQPKPIRSLRESNQSEAIRFARTCYSHIAGEVGVALTDKLLELGLLTEEEHDFAVTQSSKKWFEEFGIPLTELKKGRRHFARQCLDWSERRHHLAGTLGTAITNRLFELEWIVRIPGGRAIRITDAGTHGFKQKFGISLSDKSYYESNSITYPEQSKPLPGSTV